MQRRVREVPLRGYRVPRRLQEKRSHLEQEGANEVSLDISRDREIGCQSMKMKEDGPSN